MPPGSARGSKAGFNFDSHAPDILALNRAAEIAFQPATSTSRPLNSHLNSQPSPTLISPLRLLSPLNLLTSSRTMSASKRDEDDEAASNVPLLGVEINDPHKQLRSRFTTKSEPQSPTFIHPSTTTSSFNPSINQSILHDLKLSAQVPNPQGHASFVSLLDEEIQRINAFILQQLSELKLRFNLIDQQSTRLGSSSPDISLKQPFTASAASDDITLDPTRASYVDLYKQVMSLQSFAIMNCQTFLSIIAGYSLFSQSERQQFESMIESLEIAHNRETITLADQIESVYAELSITSIKSKVFDEAQSNQTFTPAVKRSQARALLFTGHRNPTSWSTFDRGFRLGITLLLFFWVIWDCVVDARLRPTAEVTWVASVLPVYRGIGVALLLGWGWGCNLYVWQHFKINYVALLDLDPIHPVTYTDVFDETTEASLMFLGNFLLYFKVLRGDFPNWIPAGYFPVTLFLYMVYKVIPWRPGTRRQRRVMWTAIIQVVFSPLGRVSFLTIYTGDILTSLVKPIIDWAYTLCFLFTLEWTDARVKDEICFQSPLFNYGVVPLLSALPLWFRFLQCLKRYTETHKRWPHLANAGKYALAHSVVLFGVFHHSFTDPKSIDTYRIYWICALIVSSLYSYAWDIFMDFGLGSTKHGGLRESQMYSNKWVYYIAIVADLFLRFAWSLTLVPRGENAPFAPSIIIYLQPLLAVGEVLRRSMWGALRLEWEHIQTLGYKKLDSPPTQQHQPSQSSDRTGWQIILEVSLIVLTVLSIALFAAATAT